MFNTNQRITRFGRGGSAFYSPEPMSEDLMLRAAPSIFAEEKHDSRSEKFTYIPTIEVLRNLNKEGFNVHEVRQGGSKDEVKRGFTKHMIRLRKEGVKQVGDSFRELILVNAHDGTSSYQLMSGVFRLVCSNGMVCSEGDTHGIRVPHKGDIISQVIEGAYQVIDQGELIDNAIDTMQSITLSSGEQEAFAMAAAALKFEDTTPLKARQINAPRRTADIGNDLWKTFNRAQENLTKGGLSYIQTNELGINTRRTTRPVNGIDGNLALNRALWTLGAEMQRLKAA